MTSPSSVLCADRQTPRYTGRHPTRPNTSGLPTPLLLVKKTTPASTLVAPGLLLINGRNKCLWPRERIGRMVTRVFFLRRTILSFKRTPHPFSPFLTWIKPFLIPIPPKRNNGTASLINMSCTLTAERSALGLISLVRVMSMVRLILSTILENIMGGTLETPTGPQLPWPQK